jgi:hypothetical protein
MSEPSTNSGGSQSTLGDSSAGWLGSSNGGFNLSSGTVLPSGSGASDSSMTSWGSLSSLSSSSSHTCGILIDVAGTLQDSQGNQARNITISLILIGCRAEEASASIQITQLAPNPQNERNSPLWTIDPVQTADGQFQWTAVPTWYGSGPNGLCYGYGAPFRITAYVACPHCTCYDTKDVVVTLPHFNDEMLPSYTFGNLVQYLPPEYMPSIGLYRAGILVGDFTKQGQVNQGDHISQYRDKIRIEENFHHNQWLWPDGTEGSEQREKGGCGDLYTGTGLRYWLGYVGSAPLYFYGNTAAEAEEAALAAVEAAFTSELDASQTLFDQRECHRELKAKQQAGFREAYTLACTYSCSLFPNPNHPAW